MRSPRSFFVLAVSATLLIGPRPRPTLAAQDDRVVAGHWECRTIMTDKTMYFTAVWDDTLLAGEVSTGFAQYLLEKYKFKGQVSCSVAYLSGSTLAKIQTDQKSYVAQLKAAGDNPVETGWVFVPAKAQLPVFCYGSAEIRKETQRQGYYYATQALSIPGNSQGGIGAAWVDYLKTLHPGFFWNPAGCFMLLADPARWPSQIDGAAAYAKQNNYQMTAVDWTWRPGQGVPTAADTMPAYFCQMLTTDQKTRYTTNVYPVEGTWDWTGITRAWVNYIKSYAHDPSMVQGACEEGRMKLQRQTLAGRIEQDTIWGKKVVVVDWKYVPGQAATAPAPTSAAAASPAPTAQAPQPNAAPAPASSPASAAATAPARAAQEVAYLCQWIHSTGNGQGQTTYYLTEAFTSTTPQQTLMQAWQKYIGDTYHPQNQAQRQASCARLPPSQESQQALVNAITTGAAAGKAQVVRVNWRD